MSAQDPLHALLPYLPVIIVMILLFRRTQRSRTLNPGRLWVGPVIFLAILGFYLNGALKLAPPPHPLDWLVIVGTGVVGAVLGAVRAHSVHLQLHPETGAIEARLSAWGLFAIVAWIAGRMLLRQSGVVDVNSPFGLYNESAMALALGAVLTHAIVLIRRCQSLRTETRLTSDKLPGSAV